MSNGVWFGDIAVGWLTDKDTSIGQDIVEKEFFDDPPQVYDLNTNLENGDYSFVLNESVHPRGETLIEQIDGTRSMPTRHPSEFPFKLAGDKGHVVPDNVSVSITPSQKIEVGDISLRFLEDNEYRSGFNVNASKFDGDYTPSTVHSVLPIPKISKNVQKDGISVQQDNIIDGKDGLIEYYKYTDNLFEYDLPTDDYTKSERINPVRVFEAVVNGSGSYGTEYGTDYASVGGVDDIRRVYSDVFAFEDNVVVGNGFILSFFLSDKIELYYYDSGADSWKLLGQVNFSRTSKEYIKFISNYQSTVGFVDSYDVVCNKGFPVIRFDFTDESQLEFEAPSVSISNFQNTTHYTWFDVEKSAKGFMFIAESDGSWGYTDGAGSDYVRRTGLDTNKEYSVWVGWLPSEFSESDLADYLYSIGDVNRSMIKKGA